MSKARMYRLTWSLLWLVWLALIIQPERRTAVRLAMLSVFFLQVGGGLWLFRANKTARGLLAGVLVVIGCAVSLPGRHADTHTMREAYVDSLKAYEGTPYYWGGENKVGIDCSGLIRKGLIRANLFEGLMSLNGRLVREALSLWWFDASAKAMRDEYRGKTTFLFEATSINKCDHSKLQPGDIAVTSSGVHILVYVGDDTWMHAAPDRGRAMYERIPVADSPWFGMPVFLMRWRQLE